jgi:hypothetical protein
LPSKRRATGCISSSRCKITRPPRHALALANFWRSSGTQIAGQLPLGALTSEPRKPEPL